MDMIRQRLEHDRRVVVVGGFECRTPRRNAGSGGDRKGTDVVLEPRTRRRDEVGQGPVGSIVGVADLLAERVQPGGFGTA